MPRSGASGKKRMLEVALLVAFIACGVALFRHNARAEEEKLLKAERQAAEMMSAAKEMATEVLETAPGAMMEAVKYAYHPADEQSLRVAIRITSTKLLKSPDDLELLFRRVGLKWQLGEYQECIADLSRVLELEPDNPRALYGRASVYYKLKQYPEAIKDLDRLIVLDPKDEHGGLNDRAYYKAKLGEFASGLKDIRLSLELHPGTSASLDTLGYIMVGLERYQEAVEAYDGSLELEPNSAYSLRGRAVAYRQLGNEKASELDLARLAELDPSFCLHWEVEDDPGRHLSGNEAVLLASP